MEGRAPQGKETFCDERNGKGENYLEAQRQLCNEREEVPLPTSASVSIKRQW